MQLLQALFRFPEMTGVGDRVPFAIGQEYGETHIDASNLAGRNMVHTPLCIHGKLTIVAIRTPDEPYPLDLLRGKVFNALPVVADQSQAANATAIGEADMLAIQLYLPAGLLILDRPIIMLKTRIAFLARRMHLAAIIEAGDSKPGSISRYLTSLRIERVHKGNLTGKDGTGALQIIPGGARSLHPQAQGFIADKLNNPYRLVDGGVLGLATR